MSDFTNRLNAGQGEAVFYRDGPLLVLAGAGSGKTRVITERIAALVDRDVPSDAITAVTFTNKAAKEMGSRLKKRLGKRSKGLRICTFHALGLSMLRQHAGHFQRRPNLSVFAIGEQRGVLRSVLQDMHLPADAKQLDAMLGRLSLLKNGLISSEHALQMVREQYDTLLERMNAVDFDDLLLLPVQLLSENTSALALWRERCRHFLVDEYQDSSRVQYELVRLLVPPQGNLTVVGDDDQSIYGWRGAEISNLFNLDKDYPKLKVVRLEENYRSSSSILLAANRLINNNDQRLGKVLRSNLGLGKPVRIWENDAPEDEAVRVVADILARHATSKSRWNDFSILYRASYQSRPLEIALRERSIPYHISGGLSFFDRAEVRDVLSYLRLAANPDDDLAFMRAITRPRRGIGDKALGELAIFSRQLECSLLDACLDTNFRHVRKTTLSAFASMISMLSHQFDHGEPNEAFDALMDQSGLEEAITTEAGDERERNARLANVYEIRRWWLNHAKKRGNLSDFIQSLTLLSDRKEEESGNTVRLMTVHAAKGLEFAHVYIIGMEDGSFPHNNAVEEKRLEEERRLMYVAVTRARFCLTLSCSKKRRRYGQIETMTPSPFLQELSGEFVEWVDREPDCESALEEVDAHMASIRRTLGLEQTPV